MTSAIYRDASIGGCVAATCETRPDGSLLLRSTEPLGWFPDRLTDSLEQWAAEAPDRTLVARRGPDGQWIRISYAQMLARVHAVGQSLVDLGLSVDRPLAILSENDLEHLTLALAAMWAGVPFAPVSSAYSLISQDYGKLRHILGILTPGMVFAASPAYAAAIATVVACAQASDVVLIAGKGHEDYQEVMGVKTPFSDLVQARQALARRAAQGAHA